MDRLRHLWNMSSAFEARSSPDILGGTVTKLLTRGGGGGGGGGGGRGGGGRGGRGGGFCRCRIRWVLLLLLLVLLLVAVVVLVVVVLMGRFGLFVGTPRGGGGGGGAAAADVGVGRRTLLPCKVPGDLGGVLAFLRDEDSRASSPFLPLGALVDLEYTKSLD